MRVKFIRSEQFESEGRNKGPKFEAGEVYDFTEEFGQRWVRRDAVEVLDANKAVKENTFKPLTQVHVEPEPELVAPVAPPPPNFPVEGPTLSPKLDAPAPVESKAEAKAETKPAPVAEPAKSKRL